MIGIAVTIAGSLFAGLLARRRLGARADRVGGAVLNLLLYGLYPLVLFTAVTRLHVDPGVLGGVALGWAALAVTGLTAWLVGARLLHLPRASAGALIAVAVHGNTGYLGLPLAVALLGPGSLATAAVYDGLVQAPVFLLGVFAVAAAFGDSRDTRDHAVRRRLIAALLRNPPLLAVLLGLAVPDQAIPAQVDAAVTVITILLLPLGYLAAGITLGGESRQLDSNTGGPRHDHTIALAVVAGTVLRMVISPLVLLALAAPLLTLPTTYLLLAATPAGVNGLAVAHAYGLDRRLIARVVITTTAFAVSIGVTLAIAG